MGAANNVRHSGLRFSSADADGGHRGMNEYRAWSLGGKIAAVTLIVLIAVCIGVAVL